MKTAMLLVSELLADWSSSHPESEFLPLNLLQIHDELVVETPGGDEEIIEYVIASRLGPAFSHALLLVLPAWQKNFPRH